MTDNYINKFYLDNEKDIVVSIYSDDKGIYYVIDALNHHTNNLIENLAKVCCLKPKEYSNGIKYIKEYIPAYITSRNTVVNVMRLNNIKIANIYPDGRIEQKATIPAINKTLMSQTKDYKFNIENTIVKTYIKEPNKFRTDLHSHMNGNLSPDLLIALGIYHQIAYPYYYVKKLNLTLNKKQQTYLRKKRKEVEKQFADSPLKGKYLERRIDDNVTINFRDLIVNNIENSSENINKIRNSLSILKGSQAVFTDLERLYLYRYVFTKPKISDKHINISKLEYIEDEDIKRYVYQMVSDHKTKAYHNNNLLKDKLLWIARTYQSQGIKYVEISNTTLTKNDDSMYKFLETLHEIMPTIKQETGVTIRFLAAIRRTPLNIIKDAVTPQNYLRESLDVIKAIAKDPYVAGCDFVGEEINDIEELEPVIRELVNYASTDSDFTIRIHAGENDSLKNNVSNSIKCVKKSLQKNQKMPKLRIGHGLYTENFKSQKGRKLINELKKSGAILEFQLTSNVRLNNLINLSDFPIKKYLANGIKCVQGSDGCGLYGITSIEEQLSLENLIRLTDKEIKKMRRTEETVIHDSLKGMEEKQKSFEKFLNGRTIKEAISNQIEINQKQAYELELIDENKIDSSSIFADKIKPLPFDKLPVVIAGGSFNTAHIKTKTNANNKKVIDKLLKQLDPKKVYFVIGNKLDGYEKYLVNKNTKFEIYAFVPSLISKTEADALNNENVFIRVSPEMLRMGLYKSFNYEIFKRIPSVVIVLDGTSAAANLIQEAINGKPNSIIYISKDAKTLKGKAKLLKGYIKTINPKTDIVREIKKNII